MVAHSASPQVVCCSSSCTVHARCTACVLTQQFRVDLTLATVVRGLFTAGSLGWYPPSSPALHLPVYSQHRQSGVET